MDASEGCHAIERASVGRPSRLVRRSRAARSGLAGQAD
jgi:hypothetical protein